MNSFFKNSTPWVFCFALLFAGSTDASAQNRGGVNGGGAAKRHGGSFKLVFDRLDNSAGNRATCLGGYNFTTYVTTLSLDYKVNNCGLPDGTPIYATVYSTDYYTGLPWLPMPAGAGVVLGGKAVLHNPNVVTTGIFGLPVIQTVKLTLAGGTVLFNGHP